MFPAFLGISVLKGLMFLVSYVTNNNTFPPPLSEEEEKKYLELFAKGDERAANVLIERNLRLVAHIVKKFESTGEDNDDLISIGTIGLIKAINTYDQSKGTKLATYEARCIENEILMYLRSTKRAKSEVMLHDPIGIDREGNEISLIDILGTEPDAISELVEMKIERSKLMEKLKKLEEREQMVLEMRYGLKDGVRKTQREIAKVLGISRSYVSRIENRALQKLQEEMFFEGYQ